MELFVCIQVNFWVKYWFFTKYLLNISLIPCAENKRFFAQYLVTMKFLQPAHPLFYIYILWYQQPTPIMKGGKNMCKNICQKKFDLFNRTCLLPPSPSNLFLYIQIWFRFDENLNIELYYILLLKNIFLTQTHYNNPQISSWKTTFSLFSTIIFFWPNYYYYLNFGSNIFSRTKKSKLRKKSLTYKIN